MPQAAPPRPRGKDGIAPPGWPRGVRPPGVPGWEDTATAWLFDLCPTDYRAHDVLRRHPPILARMARQHVMAALAAARDGYGTARLDLRDTVPVHAMDAVLRMYEHEGSRAAATKRAVRLVAEALMGDRWEPRL
ncbi:hypothetical protein [Streptomyces sp. SID3343]|uniref:hypothetical protein n=1 Tax=Streptomyces sp. SID3343 TaxID=2690260 RepID=UPI00136C5BEA|nr:hypothetical protein [Streptomyces sp. SID3343]MYW04082.1 hypothetical protein [Streptomyces sp. SID3343]